MPSRSLTSEAPRSRSSTSCPQCEVENTLGVNIRICITGLITRESVHKRRLIRHVSVSQCFLQIQSIVFSVKARSQPYALASNTHEHL